MLAHSPCQFRFSCLPAFRHDASNARQCRVSAISLICNHQGGSEGQQGAHGEVPEFGFWQSFGGNCVRIAGRRWELPYKILCENPEIVQRSILVL